MPALHFSIGENLGVQLAEISQEHLMDMDLDKAISIWEDAFGCPHDLAKQLTSSKLVVKVDDPIKCLVSVCEREELDPERQRDYPRLTPEDIHRKIDRFFQDYTDRNENKVYTNLRSEISDVNAMLGFNKLFKIDARLTGAFATEFPLGVEISGTVSIRARAMLKAILERQPGEFESRLEEFVADLDSDCDADMFNLNKIIWVTRQMMDILEHRDRMVAMEDFAIEQFSCCRTHKNLICTWMDEIEHKMYDWKEYASDPTEFSGEMNQAISPVLEEYFQGIDNIDQMADDFHPVEITDGYDAGWLAPDGKFFGLNGSSGNFLHIAIADELMKYYHFNKPDDFHYSIDAFIAKQGFVKIHHDWILYEGYDCVLTDKPVPLTNEQIKKIYEYGQKVYGGKLYFGYDKQMVSAARFHDMDDSQISELFLL